MKVPPPSMATGGGWGDTGNFFFFFNFPVFRRLSLVSKVDCRRGSLGELGEGGGR